MAQEPEKFYSLTTYQRDATVKVGSRVIRNHRTVGIFKEFTQAHETILGNYGDLEECGWYQYAVIEEAPYGLYPSIDVSGFWWYEFVRGLGWQPIGQKPPQPIIDMWGTDKIANWSGIG